VQYRLRAESLAKPLDDLDQRCRLFNNLPIDPTHEEWLRQRAWIRTIHGTTRIEGNTLSDIEVEGLLAGEGAAASARRKRERSSERARRFPWPIAWRPSRSSPTNLSSARSTSASCGTRVRS